MPIISYGLDATKLKRGVANAKNELAGLSSKASSVGSVLGKMFAPLNIAIGALGAGFGAFKLAKIGDQYTNMASQLEYLTGSTEAAEVAQEKLYQMSQKTRTSVLENSKALTRFELASEMTKLSTEENIKVLGSINTLMIRTGVSTQEASAGMIQLGQSMASGRLQGDEFRSISENMPALMSEMSKSLGVTRHELKLMSTAGELTSEVIGKVFLEMAESADGAAATLPLTISGMWTKVVNATQRMWDIINDQTGILSYVSTGFDNLATWVENNTDTVVSFFVSMKDKAIESWPEIKKFFVQFYTLGYDVVRLFSESWPTIKTVIQSTVTLVKVSTPYLITMVGWIVELINKLKTMAAYTPLAAMARAAGTVAGGGGVIDAGKAFFDADGSQLEPTNSGSQTNNNTTVNLNISQNQSKSDIENIANDLSRQEALN